MFQNDWLVLSGISCIERLIGRQFVFVFGEQALEFIDGFFQAVMGISAGCIFVPAAVEMFFANFLYIQVAF